MKKNRNFLISAITTIGLIALISPGIAVAQNTGIKRTELQRHDLSTPRQEAVQVRIDFEKGTSFGAHKHPGEEVIYVLEGTFIYEVEGHAPATLKAGDVLFIPAGTIHAARNAGKGKAVELATYIVEKGKPLVEIVTKTP